MEIGNGTERPEMGWIGLDKWNGIIGPGRRTNSVINSFLEFYVSTTVLLPAGPLNSSADGVASTITSYLHSTSFQQVSSQLPLFLSTLATCAGSCVNALSLDPRGEGNFGETMDRNWDLDEGGLGLEGEFCWWKDL